VWERIVKEIASEFRSKPKKTGDRNRLSDRKYIDILLIQCTKWVLKKSGSVYWNWKDWYKVGKGGQKMQITTGSWRNLYAKGIYRHLRILCNLFFDFECVFLDSKDVQLLSVVDNEEFLRIFLVGRKLNVKHAFDTVSNNNHILLMRTRTIPEILVLENQHETIRTREGIYNYDVICLTGKRLSDIKVYQAS
jgi:hypothetical protein